MFTGMVEELGRVKKITYRAAVMYLELSAKKILFDAKIGESIAVNGACLSVAARGVNSVSFQVMDTTARNTNLGLLKIGQAVNLERSLKVGDRISGHFVSGHIDCLGLVRRKFLRNGSVGFEISVPPDFMRYCLPKGSVSIDGISLTLALVRANIITVYIIPHTLKSTTLSFRGPSDKLNMEFDILAKKIAI